MTSMSQSTTTAPGPSLLKPRLWDVFQAIIGTNRQKVAFLRRAVHTPGRVLEVGCATGNVAQIFVGMDYTGIDTDAQAIALARVKYQARPNMKFVAGDLFDQPFAPGGFDDVVVSHTAHHIPDGPLVRLLTHCHGLLRDGGRLIILDMVRPAPGDPWAKTFYQRLDRGEHFRVEAEFVDLLQRVGAFSEVRSEVLECRKLGVRVIDQVLIEARKAGVS